MIHLIDTVVKVICLTIAIMYGMRCVGGLIAKQGFTSFHVFIFAFSTAWFVALQWLI